MLSTQNIAIVDILNTQNIVSGIFLHTKIALGDSFSTHNKARGDILKHLVFNYRGYFSAQRIAVEDIFNSKWNFGVYFHWSKIVFRHN